MRNHPINQRNPSIPEKANAHRQPAASAIQGITRAAKAPPTLESLSKIATARPRSSFGNHTATVLLAPGQLKPSPTPNLKRNATNPKTEMANPVNMFTADQKITATANPIRVPAASRKLPPRSHVSAYEI